MEWVIIANRAEANIFTHTEYGSLKLIKTMDNPLGRLKNNELQNDKPGINRVQYKGTTPYTLTAEKDPHTEVANQFAKKLVDYLMLEWKKNHELKYKIVAEAGLLGMLKNHFGKSKVLQQITWLKKDFKNIPTSEWPKILGIKKVPMNEDMKL